MGNGAYPRSNLILQAWPEIMQFQKFFISTIATIAITSLSISAAASDKVDIPNLWTPELAVEFALKNSPDSQISWERIQAATGGTTLAKAGYFPTIGLHATYGQTNNPMYSFGNILNQGAFDDTINFNDPGRTDNLNMSADITYRFYNGGRDIASVDAAEANEQSLSEQYASVQNNLAFEVVKAYQTIIQKTEMVSAIEDSMKAIEASLAVAEARYDEGDLLKEEVLNLEVQLARASENLIQVKHDKAISERIFLNLLGITATTCNIEKETTPQDIPSKMDMEKRPELQSIKNAIIAAEAELKKANGGKLPTLDGFASYQYDQGYVLDESGDSWIAGVKLDYKLYEGSQTKAHIAIAKSKLAQVKKTKIKTELALNLELEQATLGLNQAKERQLVTEKMVEVAQESARLSRVRFKEGVILSSNLIDVEMRLNDSLVRQSVAKAIHKIAIANMRRAAGLPQF